MANFIFSPNNVKTILDAIDYFYMLQPALDELIDFSENIEKKKQLYINDFVAVFGRFPEGWTPERQQEVPDPEKFISSKSGADRKSPTV